MLSEELKRREEEWRQTGDEQRLEYEKELQKAEERRQEERKREEEWEKVIEGERKAHAQAVKKWAEKAAALNAEVSILM